MVKKMWITEKMVQHSISQLHGFDNILMFARVQFQMFMKLMVNEAIAHIIFCEDRITAPINYTRKVEMMVATLPSSIKTVKKWNCS